MSNWIIQTTENGDFQPVTAVVQAPNSAFTKLNVQTFSYDDPALPTAVYSAIQTAGYYCTCVLLLEVAGNGGGSATLHISATESNMLSEDPGGIPNGVVAVFDQSNVLCLAVVPTKGGVKNEFI
ncbi:MAG: hypothetical protein RJQ00_09450 [Vicingaceae bacterium]